MAPLLRRLPTEYGVLYTVLSLAQGISAVVIGPHHKTVITLELDLYERALKIQSSTTNSNWYLRPGELHICIASLHAVGKYTEGSGLDSVSIETGIYSPATSRQIFSGKSYKRGIEYHLTNVLPCYELMFDGAERGKLDSVLQKCQKFRQKLHTRQPDANNDMEQI